MRTESVLSRLTRSVQGVSLVESPPVMRTESGSSRLVHGVSSVPSPPVMRTESLFSIDTASLRSWVWARGVATANPMERAEQEATKSVALARIMSASSSRKVVERNVSGVSFSDVFEGRCTCGLEGLEM